MGTTADKLNKVLETKEAIRTAINNKGGTLTETDKFSDYATAIDNIQSGGGGSLKAVLDATQKASGLFYRYSGTSVDDLISYNDTSNVTTMADMFYSCNNLTSIPLLDTSSCTNMNNMIRECFNITTIPQFNTSKVTTMASMFSNCNKLTSIPQLDTSSCTSIGYMFSDCSSLTSIPKLNTTKATSMNYMFNGCSSLTSIPPLDTSSCTTMNNMFNGCSKLTSIPQLNTIKVTDIGSMFNNCFLLKTIDLTYMNITSIYSSSNFASNCYSLTKLIIRNMTNIPKIYSNTFTNCYHFYGTQNDTYNPDGLKDGMIYVPDDKVEKLKTATNWSVFADNIFPLSLLGKAYISNINSKSNNYLINKSSLFFISLFDFINTPEVIITSSNEQVATISDIVITTKKITFKANYLSVGVVTITAQITGDTSATKTIDVNVIESMQYRVEQISEATYGFTLNSNEYYESTNKSKSNSYSLCKLVFNATEKNKTLKLECINSGESNFDFGILSNIDATLTLSSNTDSTNVYKSFKGESSTTPVVITYPEATVGEHFIYIKYLKDSGGNNGNDSLQFKVIS